MLTFTTVLLGLFQLVAADICYQRGYSLFSSYTTMYCGGGCCGYSYDRYCCAYITGGAIAGIVIGSLIGLAILVTIVVCVCAACKKSPGTTGRIVHPVNSGPSVAIVSSTHTSAQQWGPPAPYYPQQAPQGGAVYPPPYGPAPGTAYPPTYSQTTEQTFKQ